MSKGKNCQKKYIFSLLRVCVLVVVALIVPRFFFVHDKNGQLESYSTTHASLFKLGLENLSDTFIKSLQVQGNLACGVGLVTNHTGVDQAGTTSADVLASKGVNVKKIFVPEHDFPAYKNNLKESIATYKNIPLVMVSAASASKQQHHHLFQGIQVIFFDMQESGIYPNYIVNTLATVLQAAALLHKTVIVLDRPNILGPSMEGPLSDVSMHGCHSLPMRHGMTVAELARYFNTKILASPANLYVVPMVNYTRNVADGSYWSYGSLLTSIDTYYGASFLAAFQYVAPLDIGIGTDMAFTCLALPESFHIPKKKWFELRSCLKNYGINSTWCRYTNLYQHKYAGLRMAVPNINNFSPLNAIISTLQFFRQIGVTLTFAQEFDHVWGSAKIRNYFEGKYEGSEFEYEINKQLKAFFNNAQNACIYKPLPKVVLL